MKIGQVCNQPRESDSMSHTLPFVGSSVCNKAGYTATEVARGWAGAIFEVTRPFGQEQ